MGRNFMWRVIKSITFLPTLLIVLLSFFVVLVPSAAAEGQDPTGSITVCKAISDQNGNVIDGSQTPGATFTIAGFVPSPVPVDGVPAGALPTSTFTTPLTLNAKIFKESTGNDSQCVTYSNLPLGAYYYGQETTPGDGWQTPMYNDQFTSVVSKVSDVFSYDGTLFSSDKSDVTNRNENADGSIVLNTNKPNRTLIVVDTLKQQGSNPPGGNPGNPGAPTCNDTAPSSAPAITNVTYGQNSATITWTKAGDPVDYYLIAYGTQSGSYQWGNPNIGNVTTYTVNGLSSNQNYYFAIRGIHGCMPGPFSNEVSVNATGGAVAGIADGFAPDVLGATTSTTATSSSTLTKSVCSACLWWPVLLGELLILVALYLVLKGRNWKANKYLLGAIVALASYLFFMFLNKGHVCPDSTMSLWIFSLPCRYFWIFDGGLFIIISIIMRDAKQISNVSTKKTK